MAEGQTFIDEISEVNESYYRAFESLDIEKMAAVWVQSDMAQVIHPGWPVKIGWEEVKKSWVTIFGNTSYVEFNITDVHVLATSDFARVTCTENLRSIVGEDESAGQVQATNIFVKQGERWLMAHHHGSPIFTT